VPDESILSDDFVRRLSAVGEVDLLVGIPTLNNRATVQHVLSVVGAALASLFPRERAAIVIPDGGSRDGTAEAVSEASMAAFKGLYPQSLLRTSHTVYTRYRSLLGEGGAIRIVLAAADLLRARACALVSPDLESITPERVGALLEPVYKDRFDFVMPVYQRPPFDGLLIKNVLSPVLHTAFGFKVDEPVGGVFGFSGSLACHFLEQAVWQQQILRYGADLWMATAAMAGDYRLCQAYLGPKPQAATPSGRDLAGTIQQVVGALFRSLEIHQDYWTRRDGSREAPVIGSAAPVDLAPARAEHKPMIRRFRSGVADLDSVLQAILRPETLDAIRALAKSPDDEFRYPDELWARTVIEFAASYHHPSLNRDHILQALTPLYRGRIGAFLRENQSADANAVAEKLGALQRQFDELRPYLLERWTAGE
jgi:glucosylglycerate synthase